MSVGVMKDYTRFLKIFEWFFFFNGPVRQVRGDVEEFGIMKQETGPG